MTPLARPDSSPDLRSLPIGVAARELLAELGGVRATEPGSFLRLERPVEASRERTDLFRLLQRVGSTSRRYFRTRSGALEVVGFGEAARLGPSEIAQHGGTRDAAFFLAAPFDAARPRDPAWTPFTERASVLPAVEIRREGEGDRERCQLAVNLAVNLGVDPVDADSGSTLRSDAEAARILEALAVDAPQPCVVEPTCTRVPADSAEASWTRAVRAGLAEIRSGALRKIVLGRTLRFVATDPLDPASILARLAERETRGFRFLIEPEPGRAFVGITPERLFSRLGSVVRSEAVAGTRPRGVDGAADRLMGEALLASAKDRREQALVVERVREALAPLSLRLRIDDEPRLLRLAYVQHLATRLVADLRDGVRDADLLAALHPTPAVAGSPVREAVAAIRGIEPFDRGLFAGPVGVVSRSGAEIAVGIRSALVDGETLTAFAGAGIVDGSDPAEEWRETGHKLLGFERIARAR